MKLSDEKSAVRRRVLSWTLGAIAVAWGGLLPAAAARAETAILQGLDKITARISTFEAPVNQTAQFGSLEITVRRCHKTPPEELPESAAFMEIVDDRPDSPSVVLFSGWMFASSPALSALEHPVYDVWIIDCIADLPAGEAGETGATGATGESVEEEAGTAN